MMISGCHSGQTKTGENSQNPEVRLNGVVLVLSDEKNLEITGLVVSALEDSDEFYELLVTDNLLQSITEKEEYLEITFPETRNIKTKKFGEMEIGKILIPLSGKFAGNGQLTFFNGKVDFSNTPLIRSSGLEELKKLVEQ